MSRLLVLANDEIAAYVAKGEIKERYYNPENRFTDIRIVTPGHTDIDSSGVQAIAGTAKLEVIPVGRFRPSRPWSFRAYRDRLLRVAQDFDPDVIRAFNPHVFGAIAVYCARRLGVPSVISVHNDYDHDYRHLAWVRKDVRRMIWAYSARVLFERPSLRGASAVIAVYEAACRYARRALGTKSKRIDLIYNRVFEPRIAQRDGPIKPGTLQVITVSGLYWSKHLDILIRAIAIEPRTHLVIIGDGPERTRLEGLIRDLGVSSRVDIVGAVPHAEIFNWYAKADVFAAATRQVGIGIPTIEAASAKLPLIVAKTPDGRPLEIFGDSALQPEPRPGCVAASFRRILDMPGVYGSLSRDSFARFQTISGRAMEEKERMVYDRVLV